MKIRGYAAVFNSDSENLGGFIERIAPGAFADTLRENDIVLLSNHNTGKPLARASTGSLKLSEDNTGLRFSADLPDTPGGQEMMGLVGGRVVLQMSFSFSVARAQDEEWREGPNGLLIRTLKRVSLGEISPVTFPAYTATSVTAGEAITGKRSTPSKAKQVRTGGTARLSDRHAGLGPYEAKRIRENMVNGIVRRDPASSLMLKA